MLQLLSLPGERGSFHMGPGHTHPQCEQRGCGLWAESQGAGGVQGLGAVGGYPWAPGSLTSREEWSPWLLVFLQLYATSTKVAKQQQQPRLSLSRDAEGVICELSSLDV